ncbi:hypothetical protein ACFWAA_21660 [Streptomyces sp. NPDC059922]|uniref:hypothetical protein n=1 Tax=Streptomyces sp. NPDC059922 TaxID=3347005 RepID=UPI003669D123
MPELLASSAQQDALGQSPSGRSRTLEAQWETALTVTERGIGDIRRAIRAQLQHWGREEAGAVARLGVSELLTNVLRHAHTPDARIAVRAGVDSVYVVVSDLDRRLPVLRPPIPSARTDEGSRCWKPWQTCSA